MCLSPGCGGRSWHQPGPAGGGEERGQGPEEGRQEAEEGRGRGRAAVRLPAPVRAERQRRGQRRGSGDHSRDLPRRRGGIRAALPDAGQSLELAKNFAKSYNIWRRVNFVDSSIISDTLSTNMFLAQSFIYPEYMGENTVFLAPNFFF